MAFLFTRELGEVSFGINAGDGWRNLLNMSGCSKQASIPISFVLREY